MAKVISRNPATGETLRELEATPPAELPAIFERARAAQLRWAAFSPKKRSDHLRLLRETLLNHADEMIDLLSLENGKPKFEALANEVVPTADMLSYFAKHAPILLRDRPIPLTLMKHRKSVINYWPVGVVAVISPWNYPLLLPMGDILMALVAGNAVVFKPSEVTPQIGLKIQDLCDESGLPPHLIQTVIGDGTLGAAIIDQKPDKIFFTGSAATGKRIMAAAAQHLIPVNLELGGKNAAIVLSDADLEFTSSALLWGAFGNSGQVCAAAERLLVHESVAGPLVTKLKEKIPLLRQGASGGNGNDLGVITLEKQKAVYEKQLEEAKAKGATIEAGGEFNSNKTALQPTVVTGNGIESLSIYNEETFGPVVAVTTFKTPADAVEKANRSPYGLVASVFTRNLALGENIARQLQAGTVMINEVTYTAGLGETPWGGVKESGIGRTHADIGLYEFVNVRHIHKPRSRLFVFKSFWWFPYTPYQYLAFRKFLELYRRHWTDKIRAFPHFLLNFVTFLKNERRL